jgi:FAD:protein FMN transferase
VSTLRRLLIAMTVCVVAGWASLDGADPSLHKQSRKLMGTFFEIQVYHADAAAADRAMTRALDEMQRVDRLLSNYDPASELSAMNRTASQSPYRASEELFGFIKQCQMFFKDTVRAFDPTVGPLVRAWGFFTRQPARPSDEAIAAAKAESGFDKVQLDDAARTVSYSVPGLEIDPGGIGKGYAVDQAVQVLKQQGIVSALISAGGSTLYAVGHPPDRAGWQIAVADPSDPQKHIAMVELRDDSLSTSGVSQQSVQVGSHRYSHIFDPRNGEPVEGMCQVTVIAPTATESDALTKAAFILSRDSTVQLFRRRADVHALRVEGPCGAGSSVWMTPWSAEAFARNPSGLH